MAEYIPRRNDIVKHVSGEDREVVDASYGEDRVTYRTIQSGAVRSVPYSEFVATHEPQQKSL